MADADTRRTAEYESDPNPDRTKKNCFSLTEVTKTPRSTRVTDATPLIKFKKQLPAETGRLNTKNTSTDAGRHQVHTKKRGSRNNRRFWPCQDHNAETTANRPDQDRRGPDFLALTLKYEGVYHS